LDDWRAFISALTEQGRSLRNPCAWPERQPIRPDAFGPMNQSSGQPQRNGYLVLPLDAINLQH
jgi:hypothetical protein